MFTQLSCLEGHSLNLWKEIYTGCPYMTTSQSSASRTDETKISLSFHTLSSNEKKTTHLTTGVQAKADGTTKLIQYRIWNNCQNRMRQVQVKLEGRKRIKKFPQYCKLTLHHTAFSCQLSWGDRVKASHASAIQRDSKDEECLSKRENREAFPSAVRF